MPKVNEQPSVNGVYVNTTDATQTTAATFTTRSNKAYGVTAKVLATETTDFDEQAFYVMYALFKNDGGTLALVGAVAADATIESTSGWAATLDASGDDIRVRVTGASSTNISWKVELDVQEAGKYVANAGILE